MKTQLIVLLTSTILISSPIFAADNNLGGEYFNIQGSASFGYDDAFNEFSTGVDVMLGVPITLGSVGLEFGVRVDGSTFGGGSILAAAPYIGLFTEFGDVYVGGIEHSTDAFLPEFDMYASPYANVFMPGSTFPFAPYHRMIDRITPTIDHLIRYDGSFGDFAVSASYSENQLGSFYASYDFDIAKVFAGTDTNPGGTFASYVGAEATFGQFDGAIMATLLPGGGPTYYALLGTYHINDAFDVSAIVKGNSGGGAPMWGLKGGYQINDLLDVSLGYAHFGGTDIFSAGVTIDLN